MNTEESSQPSQADAGRWSKVVESGKTPLILYGLSSLILGIFTYFYWSRNWGTELGDLEPVSNALFVAVGTYLIQNVFLSSIKTNRKQTYVGLVVVLCSLVLLILVVVL